jgi:hypothetical protein
MMETSQGPKMLHEGELRLQASDGRFAVIPANQVPQNMLQQLESQGQIGGYQGGIDALRGSSTYRNLNNSISSTLGNAATAASNLNAATTNMPTTPVNPAASITGGIRNPLMGSSLFRGLQSGVSSAGNAIGGTTGTVAPPISTTMGADYVPPRTGSDYVPPSGDTTGLDYIRQGLQGTAEVAAGKSPELEAAANKAIGQFGGGAAAAAGATRQYAAQSGLSAEQAKSLEQVYGRDVEAERSNLMADTAQKAMDLAAKAKEALISGGNTLLNATITQSTFDTEQAERAAETLFSQGGQENILAGGSILNKAYGINVDWSKMVNEDKWNTFEDVRTKFGKYFEAGYDFDEARAEMEKDGTLDLASSIGIDDKGLKSMYETVQSVSSPVAKLFKTYPAKDLIRFYPGKSEKEIESAMVKFSGFDSDGNLTVDWDKADDYLKGVTPADSEQFSAFMESFPTDQAEKIDSQLWIMAGRPKSSAEYLSWYNKTGKSFTAVQEILDTQGSLVTSTGELQAGSLPYIRNVVYAAESDPKIAELYPQLFAEQNVDTIINDPALRSQVHMVGSGFFGILKHGNQRDTDLSALASSWTEANKGKVVTFPNGTKAILTGAGAGVTESHLSFIDLKTGKPFNFYTNDENWSLNNDLLGITDASAETETATV